MNHHAAPPITLTDAAAVRAFVERIHAAAAAAFVGEDRPGLLQLSRIHPANGKLQVSGRFRIGDVDNMVEQAIVDAEAGFNVYVEGRTVCDHTKRGVRGSLSDTRGVFALVVDSDSDKGKASGATPDPSLIVETSPGNAHLWFFLRRALTADEAQPLGERLRASTGADSDTGVITQPYRVAGTPNYPNAKKKARGRVVTPTRLVETSITFYTTGELAKAFPAIKQGSILSMIEGATRLQDPDVLRIVSEPCHGTMDRSAVFYRAVSRAAEAGMGPDDLEAMMRDNPQGCSSKYLEPTDRLRPQIEACWRKWDESYQHPRRSINNIITAAAAGAPHGARPPPANSQADPLAGFVFDGAPIPDPAWLIKNILHPDGITFIGGQSGSGKTFIAVELAVSLASANPFFGRLVKERVGVAILAAEGAGTLPARIRVARQQKTGDDPLPITYLGSVPDLTEEDEVAALIKRLQALDAHFREKWGVRLGVVVVDTLAAAFDLDDENDNSEAAKTIRIIKGIGDALRVVMLPVHHYGKAPTTGLRGGSGWRAGCDVILSVLADRNEITGHVSRRELALSKSRVVEEGPIAPFGLEFVKLGEDEDGADIGACRVVPLLDVAPTISAHSKISVREPRHIMLFRESYFEAMADCGQQQKVMGDGRTVRAVDLAAVRKCFKARYVTGENDAQKAAQAERQAFSRVLKSLQKLRLASAAWAGTEWIWSVEEDHV